eukprot:INCI3013.1.p1 GENE.INCI3013.1~~INCI3013.1.p1  ORF type:complete len:957 (-),score=151.22 INCI3013.1:916-3618(-)
MSNDALHQEEAVHEGLGQGEDTFHDFGELVFGEYGNDLSLFLDAVEKSLLDPASRASKYMASIRQKMHKDSKLAKICILTQARIAFAERGVGVPVESVGSSSVEQASVPTSKNGGPPPPPAVRNPHRVGMLRKQPTQFGPSKLISVAEALAGCQSCYVILSAKSITFVPELLCDTNPIQTYAITESMQCTHVSADSNLTSVEIPGQQFYLVTDSAWHAAEWAKWLNEAVDAVHPRGSQRKKKPMMPVFRKSSAPLASPRGQSATSSASSSVVSSPAYGSSLSNLSDLVVDQSIVDAKLAALTQGELDVMLSLSLGQEQVACLRLLFDKFVARGCTFITADSFDEVKRVNAGMVPNDAAQTIEAAMRESLSVTFAHFLRACGPRKADFSETNRQRFQIKNLQRLRQKHALKVMQQQTTAKSRAAGLESKDASLSAKPVDDAEIDKRPKSKSDLAYDAITAAARKEALGTAALMAEPLSQDEAVTLLQRLYRSKMLARRDAAESHWWHTAHAPTVFVCFRALCDVSMGENIGLLQCSQGDYLGARVEDLAASLSGWCRMHDKHMNVGLVSMDHLELISDPSIFEHLLLEQQDRQAVQACEQVGAGGGVSKLKATDVPEAAMVASHEGTTSSKPPAPALPPKRSSFSNASALIEDPDHVTMQVSAGTHFGVALPQVPTSADARFAYEVPQILLAFEKAILPHADTVGLLRISGDQSEYDTLVAALERGERISSNIHTVANLLKIFFRRVPSKQRVFAHLDAQSLISGSVPGAGLSDDVDFEAIVRRLKEPVQSIWWWFLDFASKIVAESSINQMNPTNISTCITPNFFPEFELPAASAPPAAETPKKKKGLFSGWKMPWKKRTPELSNAEKLRKFKMQSRRITANPLSQARIARKAKHKRCGE